MLNEVCSTITIATTGVSCVSDFHDSSIIRHANYEKKNSLMMGLRENVFVQLFLYIHTYLHTYVHIYVHTYIHFFTSKNFIDDKNTKTKRNHPSKQDIKNVI